MTFLAPALLYALPLAAIPVIIHLIHLYRRRQVKWAAIMFLLMAQRMHKGFSRLRQVLILAMRVLAIAAVIFAITRPLAGGWLGLTGGAPDTILVLLDRSASMEQQNLATGLSKRLAGLRKLSSTISETVGSRSRLVLLESALNKPFPLDHAAALTDLPQTDATETAGDIPALLQGALDYITTNKTGRTDVWLLSDLRRADWDAAGGRWAPLRSAFATLQGVRFHLLCYPQPASDDLGVTVGAISRRETSEKAELLLDLQVTRRVENPQPVELPLRFVVNGASTTAKVTLKENQLTLSGYAIPIDKATKRGWGRVELPADSGPQDNAFYFVFDDPPPLRSVIVTEDEADAAPLQAVLSAAADPARKYLATHLSPNRAAEIPWDETALLVWQAPLPKPDDVLARQLQDFVAAGHSLLVLPPATPDENSLFGLSWGAWQSAPGGKPESLEWWRNDADLLANTRAGGALPVGALEIGRRCKIVGEGIALARVAGRDPLLVRSPQAQGGGVWFLGTLPTPGASSLARDGVVLFALTHRALQDGARTLGRAQQRYAAANALGADPAAWRPTDPPRDAAARVNLALRAGILSAGERTLALNRPPSEDQPDTLSTAALEELFAGLDYRVVTDTLEDTRGLTSEIWRTFLVAMALALLLESLLCLPPRRAQIEPVDFAAGFGKTAGAPPPAAA